MGNWFATSERDLGVRRYGLVDAPELRAVDGDDGPRLVGRSAPYDEWSENLGGFIEIIREGAFDKTLNENPDVVALWQHDTTRPLGRTSADTLMLESRSDGLWADIIPPSHEAGVVESIRRQDVRQMSFGFSVVKDSWEDRENEPDRRELLEVRLFEVSAVTFPAYPGTSIDARSFESALRDGYLTHGEPGVMGGVDRQEVAGKTVEPEPTLHSYRRRLDLEKLRRRR